VLSFDKRFVSEGRPTVLETRFSAVDMRSAVETVMNWLTGPSDKCRYVCVSGVHGVMEASQDGEFRRILNSADLNVPDGMPIVWIGRLAGFGHMGRVFGPDLMLEVCKMSARAGVTHYFYGGNEGVADELAEKMGGAFPGLKIAGTYCPPFRPLTREEEDKMIVEISSTHPDILWVGLSTPKQEKWAARMASRLHAKVILCVGAAFDYNTGRLRRAPQWMQWSGLEWLYRVLQEPRRLYKRYLRNNPLFVFLALRQLLGLPSGASK